ncbi:hypothetical protein [Carnobacterium maltaromaticum]|uniref:hypothetical protein n=1 Tax=Carnobacterium maltaromaticum TaxID=2751 RepID=UPI0039BDB123
MKLLEHMILSEDDSEKRVKKRKKIERELKKELKNSGLNGPIFEDRLQSYLSYWDIEQNLLLDIQIRGPNIEWNNGGGQNGVKKNDSVTQLPKISKEMRDILQFLSLKPVDPQKDGGDTDGDSNV